MRQIVSFLLQIFTALIAPCIGSIFSNARYNIGAVTETGSIELRAWHGVRVLSAPPRTLALTEISQLWASSAEFVGLFVGARSLQRRLWVWATVSARLSLAVKSRLPATETVAL